MSYHTKFRRSRSNRLSVGMGPKKFGDTVAPTPLNVDVAVP